MLFTSQPRLPLEKHHVKHLEAHLRNLDLTVTLFVRQRYGTYPSIVGDGNCGVVQLMAAAM